MQEMKGPGQELSDLGKSVQQAGEKGVDEAANLGKSVLSEGGGIVKGAVQGGKEIATDVAATVGETVGEVAAEAIPVIGDFAAIGLGIYDLVHSFADKPREYNVSRPTFAAGI
jgi:hypothetical protein